MTIFRVLPILPFLLSIPAPGAADLFLCGKPGGAIVASEHPCTAPDSRPQGSGSAAGSAAPDGESAGTGRGFTTVGPAAFERRLPSRAGRTSSRIFQSMPVSSVSSPGSGEKSQGANTAGVGGDQWRLRGFALLGCCKICTKGQACGDSCIDVDGQCEQPSGCACDSF